MSDEIDDLVELAREVHHAKRERDEAREVARGLWRQWHKAGERIYGEHMYPWLKGSD